MANDIERMGDHCFNIVLLAQRAYDRKFKYAESSRQELDVRPGLVYIDMMNNFEKIGDYCYNVTEMVSKHMPQKM